MIVVETKLWPDGRRYQRRHCFNCGMECNSITEARWIGVRPHPKALAKIYADPNQLNIFAD